MPVLEQLDRDIYAYYDGNGNRYWCATRRDALKIYQKLRIEYVKEILNWRN